MMMETTSPETKTIEAWEAVAEKIYEKMMDGHIENVAHVHSIFEEEKELPSSLFTPPLPNPRFTRAFEYDE